jgi:hypothetical protein
MANDGDELILLAKRRPIIPGSDQWTTQAYIAVGSNTPTPEGILLTPDCVTPTEIRYWADRMIQRLEGIKLEADRIQWNNRATA